MMRLQKFLAHAGVASRRAAEELILQGHVSVNGTIVTQLGTSVDDDDRVAVDGKNVTAARTPTYVLLNKPAKVMTTMRDPEGRTTIVDLLPKGVGRVVPVGRLDFDTSGLLLLTNDGDLANVLTHPRFGVEKTYRAIVRGMLDQNDMEKLREGVRLEEFRAAGARLKIVAAKPERSVVDLTIHEGKYRQVRRMFEAIGHPVVSLERLRFGPLALGSLRSGQSRRLTAKEIAALRAIAAKAGGPWKPTN